MPEPKPARAAVVATNTISYSNGNYTPSQNPFTIPSGDQGNFVCNWTNGRCYVYFKDPNFFTPPVTNPLSVSTSPTQALTPSGNPAQSEYAIIDYGSPDKGNYPYTIKKGGFPKP